MPAQYDAEAIQLCLSLYLRFNGQQHDRIQQEMRRTWPGWTKQNLYTRGKEHNLKIGWIEKFGWEKALEIHLAQRTEARTSAEQAVAEIEEIRRKLFEQLKAQGARYERDLVYQHRDYSKLYLDAVAKLRGETRTLDDFVAMWERLLDILAAVAPATLAELLKVDAQVLEKAAALYGDKEDRDGG